MNEIISNESFYYKEVDKTEVEKLLAGAYSKKFGDYYSLLLLIASTGISLPEALELKWEDVDLENKVIEIRSFAGRKIKICQSVVAELKGMLTGEWVCELLFHEPDGSRLNPVRFAKDLREIRELAGVSDSIGINTLRFLHGLRLLDLNVHPNVICRRLGQETGKYVIDNYYRIKDQGTAVEVMEEAGGYLVS